MITAICPKIIIVLKLHFHSGKQQPQDVIPVIAAIAFQAVHIYNNFTINQNK